MIDLFLKLVNNSLAACWLVAAVVVLRFVLRRAPQKWICMLWLLVAIRLIFPFSIESRFSLQPVSEPIRYTAGYYQSVRPLALGTFSEPSEAGEETPAPQPEGQENTKKWNVTEATCAIWAVGVLAMVGYGLFRYAAIRRQVSAALCLNERVFVCDYISTPFVLGILRPEIYLPSEVDTEEVPYILAHERTHIRRKDHWWKLLGYLLLSLHWLNPVLWLAYGFFCRDVELACDEAVIQGMDVHEKAAYSRALLHCSTYIPASVGVLAFGRSDVEKRIRKVLSYRRPRIWITFLAAAALVAAAVCFLTDPVMPKEASKDPEETEHTAMDSTVHQSSQAAPELRYVDKKDAPAGRIFPQEEIQNVTVITEKGICSLCSREDIERTLSVLKNLYDADLPIRTYRQESDMDLLCAAIISLETAEEKSEFSFSADGAAVWFHEEDGTVTCYGVRNPERVKEFVSRCMHSTFGKATSGTPTAGIAEPAKWLQNVTLDAIRDVYLYRDILISQSSDATTYGTSFGWMLYDWAEELPDLLRQVASGAVSQKSVRKDRMTLEATGVIASDGSSAGHGRFTLRLVDDINGFAAFFRLTGNSVELALSDELEKLNDRSGQNFQSYTLWDIQDENLYAYLCKLREEMPVVMYAAGSAYEWAEPVTVSHGVYSISLRPVDGWIAETVPYTDASTPFGIRIRPGDQEQGWLYFSAQPQGFQDADTGLSWRETGGGKFVVTTGCRGENVDWNNYDVSELIWEYMHYFHVKSDLHYVIWNEGADEWMLENMDAILDTIAFATFGCTEDVQ